MTYRPKIYLETTLFNFYIDGSKGTDHINTVRLFEDIAVGRYEAFTSAYVVKELERAPDEKRERMLGLITEYGITSFPMSDEAGRLADIYVDGGVIPKKYRTDGLHIAIAAVNDMDIIVSMNLRHIVKRKTIKMTTYINAMNGYRSVDICSPKEVMEHGKKD